MTFSQPKAPRKQIRLLSILFLILTISAPHGRTEDLVEKHPLEPIDRSSPRSTLQGYLESVNVLYDEIKNTKKEDWTPQSKANTLARQSSIIDCFDLSGIPEFIRRHSGSETASYMKEVLDRIDIPAWEAIPGREDVEAAEEKSPLKSWSIPHTGITLTRVDSGIHEGEYLFSQKTVSDAASMFHRVKNMPYKRNATPFIFEWFVTAPGEHIKPIVDRLPNGLKSNVQGHHALWQWLALVVTLLGGVAIMLGMYGAARKRAIEGRKRNALRYLLTLIFPIAAMCVPAFVGWFVKNEIRISGPPLAMVMFISNILILIAGVVVIMSIGTRVAELLIARPQIHPRGLDAQFIRILSRVFSIIAAIIVFLEGGKYLGIPLTTLLASAGVGGVAVALAAQDSLRNFFGSVMIILDKPYRIGERILVKGYDGVVEDIGIRSTRLRLLTGHQATIPNEDMARSDIENVSRRPHIRRLGDLRLPLDTPSDKVEQAVDGIRKLLKDHPGMDEEFPSRVFFTEFKSDAINIRFIYWYHPAEYWDFMDFSQKLNLQIKELFATLGIEFALPTTRIVKGEATPANLVDQLPE